MSQTVIIANPRAGSGKAPHRARLLADALRRTSVASEVHVPASVEAARSVAGAAVSRGADILVTVGGDGTVREMFDVVGGTPTKLAVLASGRGNDFVRGIGGRRSIRALARSIAASTGRRIDLGYANGISFGTVATCGLDAEVGQRTADGSGLGGAAGYVLEALKSIRQFEGYEACVEVDCKKIYEGDVTLVACANTATYGGGLRVAPGARIDDGSLDVCLVRRVTRSQAFRLLPQLAVGGHATHPLVSFKSASQVRITTDGTVPMLVDGEPIHSTALDVSIQAAALEVVV